MPSLTSAAYSVAWPPMKTAPMTKVSTNHSRSPSP